MDLSGGGTAESKVESSGDAARLPNIFEESKEFVTIKQHLDMKLKTALNEPQAETPEFETNLPWQVRFLCKQYLATSVWLIGVHMAIKFMKIVIAILIVNFE